MKRCIELASCAGDSGDFPFGSVIVSENCIVSEGYNQSFASGEVYRHAELLALVDAKKILNRDQLTGATLYSSVEPCPMCSFAIRESNLRRVVFGLRSPIMGGYSKWMILQDAAISEKFPNSFSQVPEIIPDILKDDVIEGWRSWDAEKWRRLYEKGVFR